MEKTQRTSQANSQPPHPTHPPLPNLFLLSFPGQAETQQLHSRHERVQSVPDARLHHPPRHQVPYRLATSLRQRPRLSHLLTQHLQPPALAGRPHRAHLQQELPQNVPADLQQLHQREQEQRAA